MAAEQSAPLKPAYLFSGDDVGKLDTTLRRLRERAEREGGAGALQVFEAPGSGSPDVDELVAALPAVSLMGGRRYLLADGVERWRPTQISRLAEAMAVMPEETTVVLVARGDAPKGLAEAVEKARGEVLTFKAPRRKELPAWVVDAARKRGIELHAHAARVLVNRVGDSTVRLATELDRIALWAEPGARVGVEEVEELTADSSERAGWTLGDAIVARDPAAAVEAADVLADQGEAVTPMVYGMASRLRNAHLAAVAVEAGTPAREIEASLPMAPYPAKLLVRAVQGVSPTELSEAIGAVADLEWWTRGGSDYEERLALTLAVRRAAGA
jgi:DNA polymerase III subunit delta